MSLPAFLSKWQIAFYLGAIIAGFIFSFPALEIAVEPFLALLIFATFMAVPLARISIPPKFLLVLLGINFLVVPLIVWIVTRPIANIPELIIPVSLVLLAPCVDYVIVFSTMAGGSREKLLAATPILLIVQMLALPVLVPLISDGGVELEISPFIRAFLVLILLPLVVAAFAQRSKKMRSLADDSMVPIMVITLFVVVSSYSDGVSANFGKLGWAIAVYVAFILTMLVCGVLATKAASMPTDETISVIFSGVTRNSLVILPIALALPTSEVEPAVVVVTQTLVELIAMVFMVRLLPRLNQET